MKNNVSVIMPSLNEEKNIANAIKDVLYAFDKLNIEGEIIVVNDGSTDKTQLIVNELIKSYSNIKIINHNNPQGVGKSYWDGLKSSTYEIITWSPSDSENNTYEILRYLDLMKEVDIIVPYVYNRQVRSRVRNILSKLYKGIINISFGMVLNYMNGTVIMRKSVLNNHKLKSYGFFFQTELLIKTIKQGYLYAEVPYALNKGNFGKSKAVSLKSFLSVIISYFRMVLYVYFLSNKNKDVHPDSLTYKRRVLWFSRNPK